MILLLKIKTWCHKNYITLNFFDRIFLKFYLSPFLNQWRVLCRVRFLSILSKVYSIFFSFSWKRAFWARSNKASKFLCWTVLYFLSSSKLTLFFSRVKFLSLFSKRIESTHFAQVFICCQLRTLLSKDYISSAQPWTNQWSVFGEHCYVLILGLAGRRISSKIGQVWTPAKTLISVIFAILQSKKADSCISKTRGEYFEASCVFYVNTGKKFALLINRIRGWTPPSR